MMIITADFLYAGSNIVITLPAEVRVKGESATLGGIAKIKGQDKATIEKISKTVICRLPSPGQYTRVSQDNIKLKLQTGGIDLTGITLDMPAYIKVYTDYRRIESEEIVKAALGYIKKNKLADPSANLIVTRKPNYINCKNGKIEFRFEEAPVGNPNITAVTVDILCDGKSIGKRRISFKDESSKTVNKDKGGKTTDSGVKEGTVVKPGDQLEVTVIKKNIRVTAMGTAKQSGRAGQMIRIRLDETNKTVNAKLIDEKHAQVEIP
jgi:ribosomal 50S subunit-recycling heat shock protein